MMTIHTFTTVQEAREYRHANGTGGWIFEPETAPEDPHYVAQHCVILFPPNVTPSMIFKHSMVAGKSGRLIGAV